MKYFIVIIVLAFGIISSYLFGHIPKTADYTTIYNSLITTSSILFAIIGLWIVLLYPEELKKYKSGEVSIGHVHTLVNSLSICTGTIIFIILLMIFFPIIKSTNLSKEHLKIFKSISFFITYVIAILQIYCFLTTLLPSTKLQFTLAVSKTKTRVKNNMKPVQRNKE